LTYDENDPPARSAKMAITERRMTLEEFLELPEEKPALELIDGVVKQKVAPDFLHGMVQSIFLAFINEFAMPRELALAVSEVRATLPGSSPVPDVSVYRWAVGGASHARIRRWLTSPSRSACLIKRSKSRSTSVAGSWHTASRLR
jgi:Uma2 family endonuclease